MSPQQTIAHYRITAKLGEGGMGEVWRATDTKLNRDVAIKILPEAFAADPDRLARFAREAQVLASLNHPNIAAIYGVEERALVMELVEGPTLAERIAQGAIPLEEALPVARQIAEALEYAHERNIVHRDLKPANIKVMAEGRVKVLDFGLARAMSDQPATGDPAFSPTLTMGATRAGVLLGTAAYMSPEQARGKIADHRADIWSFGVVLYEMLAGKMAFVGESISDTLASVLKFDPDWNELPAGLTTEIQRLLRQCLRKDRQKRLQSMGDARVAIEDAQSGSAEVETLVPPRMTRGASRWWVALTAVMAIALAVAGVLWWRAPWPVERPLARLLLDLGPDALAGLSTTVALSPDGRRVVFSVRGSDGRQQLATRLLDQTLPTPLPGTENARNPFISPDGQWIGFFDGAQIKKTSIQGGTPVTLTNIGNAGQQGGSWGEDGNIIASLNMAGGLVRLPDNGGKPQPLTTLDAAERTHRWPQVLPGGKAVLFTASTSISSMEDASIKAIDLKTGAVKVVRRGGYYGRYLPSGHLVYVHEGVLFGVEFNPARLEARGSPVPVLDDVAGDSINGGGQFDFSAAPSGAGTLIYVAGRSQIRGWSISWLDASGNQSVIAPPGVYYNPAFSPDGRRVAMDVGPKGTDIFVYDLAREDSTRLTFDGASDRPVWAPDGMHIIFQSSVPGHALWWVRSDGADQPVLLRKTSNSLIPTSMSHDGRRLACWGSDSLGPNGIWMVPLDISDPDHPKAGPPEPFRFSHASEVSPVFSTDDRWIAYRSSESGADEIYVRASSGGGGHWQVSAGGGLQAFWAPGGHDLFYETLDHRIMILDYTTNGASFVKGRTRVWFGQRIYSPGRSSLDLAPDGKRFAIFRSTEAAESSPRVVFLLNFFDYLQRRIATGGK
jgi:serine/threonine-protein kinase